MLKDQDRRNTKDGTGSYKDDTDRARNGHEARIKPVMELNFPRVDARVYHWFIQKVCQQGNDEGKQRKPDLKSKESSEETQEVAGHPTSKELKGKRFEYS